MRTVASLIAELQKFPPDALAYAYEGEVTGVVICADADGQELGYIPANEGDLNDDRPAILWPDDPALRDGLREVFTPR